LLIKKIMINIPLSKILFLDIETVGITYDYSQLQEMYPRLAEQFSNYFDWFQKRFPEDQGQSFDYVFSLRSALVPEFAKVICVSVSFVTDKGEIKSQTFSSHDESVVLKETQPNYDTKPWEIKAIDTKELWQFGAYTAIGSLDLMCASMGVESPKDGEVTGKKVHHAFWKENKLKEISEYCEKDVKVLIDVIKKFKELK